MSERLPNEPVRRAGSGFWFWVIALVAAIFLLAWLGRNRWW